LPAVAEAFSLLEPATFAKAAVGSCGECCVTTLRLDSRANCFLFDELAMRQLRHEVAAKVVLAPGTHLIRIKQAKVAPKLQWEPLVLLWIGGGRFTNRKTEVEVCSTWSSLAGYDDVLTLDVKEPALLCAFFLCTGLGTNPDTSSGSDTNAGNDLSNDLESVAAASHVGELTLSIVQLT
jgi:hypothetical protein